MATLVLTAIGDDQAGLVNALATVIADHGGNWDESHMSQLAGKFAGIVQVTVPDTRIDELVGALQPLEQQGLLDITVSLAEAPAPADDVRRLTLDLVGQDRLGIIHDLSHTLAELGVSIEQLETATGHAPMSGGLLFEAHAVLAVPATVDADRLRTAVETLGNELMVDIALSDAEG